MARPKGTLKFKSKKALQEAIDNYFLECDQGRMVTFFNKKKEEWITAQRPIPYTIEGLAESLKVTTRTLINYEKNEDYFPIISGAKAKIARMLMEDGLMGANNPIMTKLNLSANFGYSEKSEVEVKTKKVKFNF